MSIFVLASSTYIGEPIEYDPNRSPDQLRELVIINLRYFFF